jgi:hypothetical protein
MEDQQLCEQQLTLFNLSHGEAVATVIDEADTITARNL